MNLLFSIANANKESKISDSDFKKHFPAINKSTAWESIEPFIRQATNHFLKPYLGEKFYNVLIEVNSESPKSLQIAKEKAKDIVAFYSVWLAMPHINRVVSDLGIQENSSTDGNSQPAAAWRYKNGRWETMLQADKLMDDFLQYLEDNKEDTALNSWTESQEYKEVGHQMFRTTKELSKYTTVSSRRLFKALMPYFDQALDLDILGVICEEQYEDLVSKINTTDKYKKQAIEYIRKSLANFTLYRAIPHLRVAFESNALIFVSSSDGMNMKQTALDSSIIALRKQLKDDAEHYLSKLRGYLYTNVEHFPIFKEKGYIDNPQEYIIHSPDNIGGIMIN